jgi:hypothetical protein
MDKTAGRKTTIEEREAEFIDCTCTVQYLLIGMAVRVTVKDIKKAWFL